MSEPFGIDRRGAPSLTTREEIQNIGECGGPTGKRSFLDLGVKPGNWPADFPEPHPTAHLTGALGAKCLLHDQQL